MHILSISLGFSAHGAQPEDEIRIFQPLWQRRCPYDRTAALQQPHSVFEAAFEDLHAPGLQQLDEERLQYLHESGFYDRSARLDLPLPPVEPNQRPPRLRIGQRGSEQRLFLTAERSPISAYPSFPELVHQELMSYYRHVPRLRREEETSL